MAYRESTNRAPIRAGHVKPVSSPAAVIGKVRGSFLVWLFYLATICPVIFDIGLFSIPPYRLVLLLTVIPCLLMWVIGKFGSIKSIDVLVLLFMVWVAISISINHGLVQEYQFIGFTFIDTAGAFFLGRAIIRNAKSFLGFVKVHLLTLVLLLPFAIIETQTGDPMLIRVLRPFARTQPIISYEPRMGLERAQVVFQHPILFGVYSAAILGVVVFGLGYGSSKFKRAIRYSVVAVSTICSVSSGALVALILQTWFIAYEYIMVRRAWRWKVLAILFASAYVLVDVLSDRTPIHVFVSYLTLNVSTGYNRILIWEYGTQNVAANPIFGLGLNDWYRARWMSASIDNFWLVVAIRYGYPGIILFLGSILLLIWQLIRVKHLSPLASAIRTGVLISLGGTVVAASTVNLWGPIYAWFMFFIGATVWMLDGDAKTKEGPSESEDGEASEETPDTEGRSKIIYTRFEHKGSRLR